MNITAGILLPHAAEPVRVTLRIYFTILLLFLSYLGAQISALRPILHLHAHRRIPILHLTGWLSTFDAARTMYLSRSNPLGPLGLLMLLSGSLMTVTDLAVSGMVVTRRVASRCPFDSSSDFLVFPKGNTSIFPHYPDGDTWVPRLIKSAVATSYRNNGVRGIYPKVNRDLDFCPEAGVDSYGSWSCSRADDGIDRSYPYEAQVSDIINDLSLAGLAFNYTQTGESIPGSPVAAGTFFNSTALSNGTIAQASCNLVIMSSSSKEVSLRGVPPVLPQNKWDVLVSVENGNNISFTSDKSMATYKCEMGAPDAEWAQRFTFATVLMVLWSREAYSTIYEGVPAQPANTGTKLVENVEQVLEDVLNVMMMSVGMLEYRDASVIEDTTQGCLVDKTWIPWPVVFLFVLAAVLLIWVAGYAGWLSWKVMGLRQGKGKRASLDSVEMDGDGVRLRSDGEEGVAAYPYVPVGFMSWMKHAVQRKAAEDEKDEQALLRAGGDGGGETASATSVDIKSRSLKHFDFALDDERGGQVTFLSRTPNWRDNSNGWRRKAATFHVSSSSSRRRYNAGEERGMVPPTNMLRKASTTRTMGSMLRPGATGIRNGSAVKHDDITVPRKTASIESLLSPTSPSIDARHWRGPGETVAWAGGLRTELEKVASREDLTRTVTDRGPLSPLGGGSRGGGLPDTDGGERRPNSAG